MLVLICSNCHDEVFLAYWFCDFCFRKNSEKIVFCFSCFKNHITKCSNKKCQFIFYKYENDDLQVFINRINSRIQFEENNKHSTNKLSSLLIQTVQQELTKTIKVNIF